MTRARRALAFAAVLACAGAARAEEPATAPVLDSAAVEIARRAGDFLRAQERFSFRAVTAYEVVQDDGSKLEFGATRRYLVRRPDRVRVEVEPRSGADRLVVFDGRQLSLAVPEAKVYARLDLETPRRLDDAVSLLRDRLDVPLPLAELVRSDPREELTRSLVAAYRVGSAKIDDVACDHVALRNEDADLQLWVAAGDEPLLRRIVITYRDADGAPSFAADLFDWKLGARSSDSDFRYEPPKGTERIRFSVPSRAPAGAAPEDEG